jgi:hypothetical protein
MRPDASNEAATSDAGAGSDPVATQPIRNGNTLTTKEHAADSGSISYTPASPSQAPPDRPYPPQRSESTILAVGPALAPAAPSGSGAVAMPQSAMDALAAARCSLPRGPGAEGEERAMCSCYTHPISGKPSTRRRPCAVHTDLALAAARNTNARGEVARAGGLLEAEGQRIANVVGAGRPAMSSRPAPVAAVADLCREVPSVVAAVTPPGFYGGNLNSQHRDGSAAESSVSRGPAGRHHPPAQLCSCCGLTIAPWIGRAGAIRDLGDGDNEFGPGGCERDLPEDSE